MQKNYNGVVLLDKQPGLTSFKNLGIIKKKLKLKYNQKIKVGHTGTLDCFAEGLLVVLTGKFTKFNSLFSNFDKTYEAVIKFGVETDTLDPTGKIVKTEKIPNLDLIKEKIKKYSGKIKQRPPIFSAIHVNGERAYKKALKGTIQELPEREIEIYKFNIISWQKPFLTCEISCSKGTYIRSIARDIGIDCNSCASLASLKRTKVGPFNIEKSIKPEEFNPETSITGGRDFFLMFSDNKEIFAGILEVLPEYVLNIKNGKKIKKTFFKNEPAITGKYAVFYKKDFLAFIEHKNKEFSYLFVG